MVTFVVCVCPSLCSLLPLLPVSLRRQIFCQLMLRASSVFSIPSVVSRNMTVEFSSRTGEGFLTRTNRTEALMEVSPRWTHTTRAGLRPQWAACPHLYFSHSTFLLLATESTTLEKGPEPSLSLELCPMTRPNDFHYCCFTVANGAAIKTIS